VSRKDVSDDFIWKAATFTPVHPLEATMSSPKPNNGLLSPAPSTSPNGSGVTSPSSAKQLSVRTGSTESGNGVASASGQNGSQDLATNREQLQAKWDKQFDEIIDALAEARARYPQAEKEVEKLSGTPSFFHV